MDQFQESSSKEAEIGMKQTSQTTHVCVYAQLSK